MGSYKTLLFEIKEDIGIVSINRPEARNSLNLDVLDELAEVFGSIAGSEEVKAVIVTGVGNAFVAGADISQMRDMTAAEGRKMTLRGQEVMGLIEEIDKPVIAAVNGHALGGGCELAMACDVRLASDQAKFGQPEVNLGIIPGFGGTQRLPRLVGKGMAKYLILSAAIIDAQEALRIGLVEKVYPPEALLDEAEKLAKTIVSKAPIALRLAKRAINKGTDAELGTGVAFEAEAFAGAFSTEDRVEGMSAFLEKRKVDFGNK
jgi:enoyl-CoA hydratase